MIRIDRTLEKTLKQYLFKKKVIVLLGARQVGKTTLVKKLLDEYEGEKQYFNCDFLNVKQAFEAVDATQLKRIVGRATFIVIDEAQRVKNIGLTLKIIHDTFPEIQVIATGSSSFELSNSVNEPLTGRSLEFTLYALSLRELKQIYTELEWDQQLPHYLVYGSYPEIAMASAADVRLFLDELSGNYLYKDILEFETLKKPDLLIKLLQLLALQLGNEVSRHELAVSLQVSRPTIDRYLDLLEKVFIIFRLKSFSRNLRKEITKKEKFYFYDLGIRNSLIARYSPIHLREDIGGIWENYCIIERLKERAYQKAYGNVYYWRTHDQQEIDYLEEYDGQLHAYEFKWNAKAKAKLPSSFKETYIGSTYQIVHRCNYQDFILSRSVDHDLFVNNSG